MRRILFVALAACLLVLARLRGAAALDISQWTLPAGFAITRYFNGSIPKARSLSISGASRAQGPVITYVSSLNFADTPMNVSRDHASCSALADWQTGSTAPYANLPPSRIIQNAGISWPC